MPDFECRIDPPLASLSMTRGKVNAINAEFVADMHRQLDQLERNDAVSTAILTGNGKFFSFGLDVPELHPLSPEVMTRFIQSFCDLYYRLFLFPKPMIAAINGHAVAGGCILATACDYRIMAAGNGKIALNEITFGSTLFAGAVAMLRFCCGPRNAERILLSGEMYSPDQAEKLGLVDELVDGADLLPRASAIASAFVANSGPQFTSLKRLSRQPVADLWRLRETASISDWIDIWYSPLTRERTKSILIK